MNEKGDRREFIEASKGGSPTQGAWETHAALKTDADGWIAPEGFKGGYTLKTDRGSASFVLKEDGTGTVTL